MSLLPIAEILRRAERLPTLSLRAMYINGHIRREQGFLPDGKPNHGKTSVRIRELRVEMHYLLMRRLKRAA